jgi:hypothetical protein
VAEHLAQWQVQRALWVGTPLENQRYPRVYFVLVEPGVAVLKAQALLARNSGEENLERARARAPVLFEKALILFPPEALAAASE